MKTLGTLTLLGLALTFVPSSSTACECGCKAPSKVPAVKPKEVVSEKTTKVAVTKVTTEELKKAIASDKELVLVDARSGKWDDGKRIANAKQVGAKADKKEISTALPDKDAKIVVYCTNTKCPAGGALAARLKTLGYSNVSKYTEGIQGWEKAGNPVSK